ncbi:deoxyguanosine kinase, mitochondrial-like isoform 2-T2 [Discoglossus pictus]
MLSHKIWRLLDTSEIHCYYSRKTNLKLFCTFPRRQENEDVTLKVNKTVKPSLQSHATDLDSGRRMNLKKISVEGNIAVGKSTFLRLLSDRFKEWSFVTEPIKKWQHVQTSTTQAQSQGMGNLLKLVYEDPARWSYTFQTFSCMSRFKIQLEPLSEQFLKLEKPVQVFERSIYSDRYVFAQTLFELGHMNEMEWTMYQDWHSFLSQQLDKSVALDGILYLRASPEKCFERLQKRARMEELTVQLNYLEKLHNQHENWLIKKRIVQCENVTNIPVLTLDVDEDFETNSVICTFLSSQVNDFVVGL